jgi:hypothetical protein
MDVDIIIIWYRKFEVDLIHKGSFIMFHAIIGTPFDFAQNEYGNLTLWEQLDNETQFTPTKKYLTAVPIILYDLTVTNLGIWDCLRVDS